MWKLASFIPVWQLWFHHFYTVLTLHEGMRFHSAFTSRDTSCRLTCVLKVNKFAIVTPLWIGCRKLCMRYPFQTPGRVISRWDKQSYCLYMTSELVFVLEWKSRSGTVTRVDAHRFDSLRYEILCWCHVNKYKDTRGDRSELLPEWKKSR